MPRKPKPSARDWRVQTLTPGRKETDALADLRRLASSVKAGGPAVAKTIEHWELSDIADQFERTLRDCFVISTPEQDAALELLFAANTEAEQKAAEHALAEAGDNACPIARRRGGTA